MIQKLPGTYERCMSGHYYAVVRGDEECSACKTIEQLRSENAELQTSLATEKEESADLEAVIDEIDAIIDSPKSASSKYAVVVHGAKDMKARMAAAEAALNEANSVLWSLGHKPVAIDAEKTEVTPDTRLRFITQSWCLTCKRKVVTFGNVCCKCGNDPKKEAAKTEVQA